MVDSALVVVAVDRTNVEFFLVRKQEAFDRVDRSLDALERVLALDVVRHVEPAAAVLREGVELDEIQAAASR